MSTRTFNHLNINTIRGVDNLGVNEVDFAVTQLKNIVDPVDDQDAATKKFVMNFATGISPKGASDLATTGPLDGSPSADAGNLVLTGVTLSNLVIDSVTVTNGKRVLVKNQVDQTQNGLYDTSGVTALGYTLTRTDDTNTAQELNSAYVHITGGSTLVGDSFYQTETVVNIVTDINVWVLFSNVPNITAGDGITVVNDEVSAKVGPTLAIDGSQQIVVDESSDFSFIGANLSVGGAASNVDIQGATVDVVPVGALTLGTTASTTALNIGANAVNIQSVTDVTLQSTLGSINIAAAAPGESVTIGGDSLNLFSPEKATVKANIVSLTAPNGFSSVETIWVTDVAQAISTTSVVAMNFEQDANYPISDTTRVKYTFTCIGRENADPGVAVCFTLEGLFISAAASGTSSQIGTTAVEQFTPDDNAWSAALTLGTSNTFTITITTPTSPNDRTWDTTVTRVFRQQ
jgi:hypothetical protein